MQFVLNSRPLWLISVSNCNWALSKYILCTIIASLRCFVFFRTSATASHNRAFAVFPPLSQASSLYLTILVYRLSLLILPSKLWLLLVFNWNYRIGGARTQPQSGAALHCGLRQYCELCNCSYTSDWYRIVGEYSCVLVWCGTVKWKWGGFMCRNI